MWGAGGLPRDQQQLGPWTLDDYLLQLQGADIAGLLRTPLAFLIGHREIDALPLVLLCFQTLIKFIPLPPGPHK